ncbi:MAG: hypothetical protein HY543_11955 [Deltaproteobacteria bacterium]|nr:hypothetical protein [Deltaproteobacteria bacterium]
MAVRRSSKRDLPVTKADLTHAISQVIQVVETRFSTLDRKIDETRLQLDRKIDETRLQLDRKIDWMRQDAKEQLEAVEHRLVGRMDRMEGRMDKVESLLFDTRQDVKVIKGDIKTLQGNVQVLQVQMGEVQETLKVHGKQLDRIAEKVECHDLAIAQLQADHVPG